MNRWEMLAALPASHEASVLAADERVKLTLTWGEAGQANHHELIVEAGYFKAEDWPAGTFARTQEGGRPVGLWFPASGKLLQIPGHILVTGRTMRRYATAH